MKPPEKAVRSKRVMAAALRESTLALSAMAASPAKARPMPVADCSASWKPAAWA
ncbi:hypothetical protein D3C86_1685340 [compost metagenome]